MPFLLLRCCLSVLQTTRNTPLGRLRMAASGGDSGTPSPSPALPPLSFGRAFEAAACFRGGAGVYPSNRSDKDKDGEDHLRPVIAAAVEGISKDARKNSKQARLIIDHVRIDPRL